MRNGKSIFHKVIQGLKSGSILKHRDHDFDFFDRGHRHDHRDHHEFKQHVQDHLKNLKMRLHDHFEHKNHRHHNHCNDKNDGDDFEARNIDGSNNNQEHTEYGTTGSAFMTISGYEYDDGISTPNDDDRPSARDISNEIFAQSGNVFSNYGLSNYFWMWGQFLDHDINLTQEGHDESYNIAVPTGDIYFDPYGTGTQEINLTRSGYAEGTGTGEGNPRLQVNEITAFIDASNVYGSTEEQQAALRGEGGKLLMSEGDLLPLTQSDQGTTFLAGDVRANENVGLTSMHTVFAREHNSWVDKLAEQHPEYSDEELYQHAKAIVEAEIQHITYDEFLPLLLGDNAIDEYCGYNPDINPQIATEFATAAFRIGHTMLSSDIYRMQENGDESDYANLSLRDAFFRPDIIMAQGGIDEILRGTASSYSQDIDCFVIDDVRNFLFGPPGAGGFDLVSLNIQRGRDHGLPDFNTVREAYGLDPVDNFYDLVQDQDLADRLELLYGDISNLDLWVGGLLELPYGDGVAGETFHTIIADQFTRLRDGDRFWYEDRLDDDLLDIIQNTSLSDIIMRNTDIDCLQDDIFNMKNRMGGDDGHNTLTGTSEADLIIGFDGHDTIYGGGGEDVLYGGDGCDVFVYDCNSSGADVIRDFKVGEDYLDISDIIEKDGGPIHHLLYAQRTEEGTEVGLKDCGSNSDENLLVLLEGVFENNLNDLLLPGGSHDVA